MSIVWLSRWESLFGWVVTPKVGSVTENDSNAVTSAQLAGRLLWLHSLPPPIDL